MRVNTSIYTFISICIEMYVFTHPISAVSTHHLRLYVSRKLVFSPFLFVTPFDRDYPNRCTYLIYSHM